MDNQIRLTTLEIQNTISKITDLTEEVKELGSRIGTLEGTLTDVSEVLIDRVVATYKTGTVNPAMMLLTSDGFGEFSARAKYISLIQSHDKKLMFQVQKTKMDFEEQKALLEKRREELALLQDKLEGQQQVLGQQKIDKEALLDVTRSDEKNYQKMLEQALAEQSAIQQAMSSAIFSLKDGTPVDEGKEIALMGNSGAPSCSTGSHLHLEVTRDGARQNPADYLKGRDVIWNNEPDGSFSFNGDWNWPMNGTIRITQGFGMTHWARTGFYGGGPHTGLDMVSSDIIIRAPRKGTLYKGSFACGSSALKYVAVEHEGGIITWYFHVQ